MRKARISIQMAILGLSLTATLAISAQVTDLQVTKSGSDIVLSWATGTASYTIGVSNNDAQFPQGLTLATGVSAGPFTYPGALTNGITLQFFDVSGEGDTSPLGNYYGGAIPPPVPTIASLSAVDSYGEDAQTTTSLLVGGTLTINGSGFSTIAREDVVHFLEGITATANASPTPSTTSFQVTIPRGAVSGPFWVQIGHQVSSSSTLIILALNGFTHIRGLAFQPSTKDIWLADGNYSKYLHYTTGTTPPYVSTTEDSPGSLVGGQGFDSAGTWFAGRLTSLTNGGTRKAPTNPPGAGSAFTQLRPGSGHLVAALAAATGPSLTNTAFFSYNDSYSGVKHICELNGSGSITSDYGGFSSTNLNFASVAGLALDQNGNLFDTETTQVRKIAPSQSSSIVQTGFSTAMGVAVDQVNSSDPGELLVSDYGASTLYGVDLLVPQKQTLVAGLSQPRAACFATTPLTATTCLKLPNTDLAIAFAGEDTQIRQVADPRISLLPDGPTRVWISKGRLDDTYPSPYQNADHRITITATAVPNRRICFRVVDPPDLAPYADGTNTGHWCDNLDASSSAGTFAENNATVYCTTANSQGNAIATLITTSRYAGDNYIVQATYDTWDSSNTTKTLAETGVITAWKRIYIEKDKMFRKGGLLFSDFNKDTCSPCNQILLYDWANLSNGDAVTVFDESNTAENGGETRTINGAPHNNGDGTVTVTLNANLTKNYHSGRNTSTGTLDFANGHSGGVGTPSAGYYEANLGAMWQTYNDGLVEFWVPPDGANAVPYLYAGNLAFGGNETLSENFSQVWFKHRNGTGPTNTPQNYLHLTGIASDDMGGFGFTWPNGSCSFITVGWLEASYSGLAMPPLVEHATVHELAHQFKINPCDADHHHDSNDSWCGDSSGPCVASGMPYEKCLMYVPTDPHDSTYVNDLEDGYERLCCINLIGTFSTPPCGDAQCASEVGIRGTSDPTGGTQ